MAEREVTGMVPGRLGALTGAVGLTRGQLFAALVAIGFANGISENVAKQVGEVGWVAAVLNTFDISVIVWAALLAVLVGLVRALPEPVGRPDVAPALLAALAFLVPIPPMSWLALAGLAIWLLRTKPRTAGGAAIVVLALTIPMFWAKAIMAMAGSFILELDAIFVGWVVGTERSGNVVPFADGSGSLWIAPGCSSFDNVSLALLCSATLVLVLGRRWSLGTVLWGFAACLAVVAVNTVRIALIGLYPQQFELFHGAVGAAVAGWVTTVAVLLLCHYGVSRSAKI